MSECEHEWSVFSTALVQVCLMLECNKCSVYGTVDDPNANEWQTAFFAPSNPYRWYDNSRVTVRNTSEQSVIKNE